MEKRRKNRIILSHRYSDTRFRRKKTGSSRVNLAVLADSALQQINEKKYDTELRNAGVNSIIKIGIAFRGKNAVVKRG